MNTFTCCDIRDNQAGSKDTLAAGACKYNFFHLFGLLSPGDEGAQVGGMCIENAVVFVPLNMVQVRQENLT